MITDDDFYRKMIGLWQLTKIPMLKASVAGDQIGFTWQHGFAERPTVSLPISMFAKLEPGELMEIVENAIYERHGIYAKQWRNDFRGFSKNPLT